MPPETARTYESHDVAIVVETLRDGDFLVRLVSGAGSIRIAVPPEQIAHLFPVSFALGSQAGSATEGRGGHSGDDAAPIVSPASPPIPVGEAEVGGARRGCTPGGGL